MNHILVTQLGVKESNVTFANDGQEAYQILKRGFKQEKYPFDLIIMDQGLPIMDGLTVLGWFKEKCIAKKVKTIPVLMLSAYDREFFKAGSLEEKGVT
jgi:CheY-like chemotaxis protein